MAHKKGVGSSKNGRESASQRLGIKIFGGQKVVAGNIIVRQRGFSWEHGISELVRLSAALHRLSKLALRLSLSRPITPSYGLKPVTNYLAHLTFSVPTVVQTHHLRCRNISLGLRIRIFDSFFDREADFSCFVDTDNFNLYLLIFGKEVSYFVYKGVGYFGYD